jgi:hypothetical protein
VNELLRGRRRTPSSRKYVFARHIAHSHGKYPKYDRNFRSQTPERPNRRIESEWHLEQVFCLTDIVEDRLETFTGSG